MAKSAAAGKRKPLKDCTAVELKRDLARTQKSLGNKALLPQSKIFYTRRRDMIEAEIEARKAQGE